MTDATPSDRPTAPSGLVPAAAIEPLLRVCDLERVLVCSRREVERMRASGRLPKPDLLVGRRSLRWRPETLRRWLKEGGRP